MSARLYVGAAVLSSVTWTSIPSFFWFWAESISISQQAHSAWGHSTHPTPLSVVLLLQALFQEKKKSYSLLIFIPWWGSNNILSSFFYHYPPKSLLCTHRPCFHCYYACASLPSINPGFLLVWVPSCCLFVLFLGAGFVSLPWCGCLYINCCHPVSCTLPWIVT